ncbi:MAG: Hsp20/alpha crystallin family protein [Acidimicrobiales bacterium]
MTTTNAVVNAGIPIEEFVDDDTLVVRAEVPGIDPAKDVEITISDNMLHLRVERQQAAEVVEEQGLARQEFLYGSFSRSVPLPAGAQEDAIEARYRDGILEVRVPVDPSEWSSKTVPVDRN